jgi:hypothetical protein
MYRAFRMAFPAPQLKSDAKGSAGIYLLLLPVFRREPLAVVAFQ